jgi:hypothetical protein
MISSNKLTAILVTISLLAGFAIYSYQSKEITTQEAEYNPRVTVEEPGPGDNLSAGFAPGEGLNFGEIFKGANVTKSLNFEIPENKTTYIKIETRGNISKYLEFEDEHLLENDSEIEFTLNAEEAGFFEGETLLEIKTSMNDWGERWLKLEHLLP